MQEDIVKELRRVFARFSKECIGAERFGDFSERAVLKETRASLPSPDRSSIGASLE